ncbi:MAG TPA: recombination regulator RecX [Burkholderiaceae bacterium]|nr:recombination regulator RecX [Burkholderiaceae bacterium]
MNEGGGGAQGTASLKARALRLLARREHSRTELARKLATHAETAEQVEALLDELVAARLLSNERFADSLVHRRAERYGTATIRHELRMHGLDETLVRTHVAELERTELERATAVWERRFGARPASLAERARQTRFLLARGFSAETVRRVLGAGSHDEA